MERQQKVLVIEDYPPVLKSITMGLSEEGFAVTPATNGADGLELALEGDFDLIVLDLMLPRIDGLTILQRLRDEGRTVHVLILTARDTLDDRVHGLDLGADDYLVKPFEFEELLARVRALLRRKNGDKTAVIRVADLEINTSARTAKRAGRQIDLTAREYTLLEFLATRTGRVVTRTQVWEQLYDFAEEINSNVVDVYIGYLRKKLEQHGGPRLIHTRRGMGYVLEVNP